MLKLSAVPTLAAIIVCALFLAAEAKEPGRPGAIKPLPLLSAEQIRAKNREGCVNVLSFRADCEGCAEIEKDLIPQVNAALAGQLNVVPLDIAHLANYKRLLMLEKQFRDIGNDVPILFIGDTVLGGPKEVNARLLDVATEALERGGCSLPDVPDFDDNAMIASMSTKPMCMGYFRRPGCRKCDRLTYVMKYIQQMFPNLQIRKFNTLNRQNLLLQEEIGFRMEVPSEKRLLSPVVFLGKDALFDEDITDDALEGLLRKYAERGAPWQWDLPDGWQAAAEERIVKRFKSAGITPIIIAGLTDGVNPCVFVTIVFFVSTLAVARKRKWEMLLVGGCFSASVFVTYFLIGLGLITGIEYIALYPVIRKIFYLAVVALTFVLGIYSFLDYLKARRGDVDGMKLKLPEVIRNKIRRILSEKVKTRHFVVASFGAGFVVSILELACTGQVYLPTLTYVTTVPGLRAQAISLLALYNVMFILPLLIILVATVCGTTSQKLVLLLESNLAKTKLILAVLFIGLGIVLIVVMQ